MVNTGKGQRQSQSQTDLSVGKHASQQQKHQTHAEEAVQLLQPAPRRPGRSWILLLHAALAAGR